MSKKLKLPSPFQPQMSPSDFEKKILKRIHVQSETDFAQGLYRDDGAGNLVYQAELDKKGLKRLKKLAKEIKKNRGFVSWGKFAVLAALVASLLVFYLVFKNPLLTGWLESNLENAFGAKAELAGLDFDPLGGNLSWTSLAVADKDHPMKNLFQIGQTQFKIDTWQLVNGKVLIQNLECDDVKFATDRKTSGALAKKPAPAVPTPGTTAPAPTDKAAVPAVNLDGFADLKKLDAAALVNDQWKNLETAKQIETIKASFANPQDRFAQERAGIQSQADSLVKASADRIIGNLKNVRSSSDFQAAMNKSLDFQGEIDSVKKQAQAEQTKLEDEYKKYQAQVLALQATAANDMEKLKKIAANPQALGSDVIKKLMGPVIGTKTKELLAWSDKVQNAFKALQSGDAKQPKPDLKGGRIVSFPVPQKPGFWIQSVSASLWVDPQHKVALKATGITSDPDMIGQPVKISLDYTETNFVFHAQGLLDYRHGAQETVHVDAQVNGYPFTLRDNLTILGMDSLTGVFNAEGTWTVAPQGENTVKAKGEISSLKAAYQENQLLGKVSKMALTAAQGRVSGTLDGRWAGDQDNFTVATNMDGAFVQAFQALVAQEVKNLQANISSEVNKKIDEALGGKANADQWRKLLADNTADIKSIDDLKAKADKQVSDLQKLKKLTGGFSLPGF